MDWEFARHVVQRELLHVTSGCFCLLSLQAAYTEFRRRGWVPKLPGLLFLLPPLVIVGLLVGVREPYDAQFDPPWKSTLDGFFWAVGLLFAAWLQIRYRARNMQWAEAAVRQMGGRVSRWLGLSTGGW